MTTPQLLEGVEFHRHHPEISPDAYLHAKELALGGDMLKRTRIFLDTRYWLLIRDHLRGKQPREQIGRLYEALLTLVTSKRAICPVSVTVVGEVLKQNDPDSRAATAEVMDRLSESVVIQPEMRRIRREVRSFVSRGVIGAPTYPSLAELVWTRPWWMVVGADPTIGDWPPALRRAAAKASIDVLWNLTIVEYVRAADAWPLERPYAELHDALPQLAVDELNAGRSDPWEERGGYDKHFLAQLEVALDMHRHDIEDVLDVLFEKKFGSTIGIAAATESRAMAPVSDWIRMSFRENRVGTELPYFRILPGILTALRLDRARKYRRNDVTDFFNAATALPYCDLYLTESSFRHLLTTKPLAYDHLFNTRVISDLSEAATAVEQLLAS
ncbi:MAG TPA: hypothetical protein VFH27_04425 [Longimicrobiaceae bacterium]|nr:hypothetical protein [Longimicrobiaceae bacterium]